MKIKTAGLILELDIKHELLLSRIAPYKYDGTKDADIVFDVSQKYYLDREKEFPALSAGEVEYLWSGAYFYEKLTKYNGVMLHASCVEYEGKAYLFSARSGTGKSTHTHLWLKYLNGARIINDDKPAIRLVDGKFYAYGTPWSGKTDESVNIGVPIAGIAFLSRGENSIKRISGIKALKLFLNQTVRPDDKELMNGMLETLNKILTEVPVFELTCDMSENAVLTSLNGMRNFE